ncbi:TRAP transporter substrate-binding protein [Petroclostridium sp. X23]|uniref:TRAP transporter substrate-binding protein n=1 Tax=Petroclostridium sp. X23 TaxID=3045146 RepID=UPI0024AD73A8|nr:TRAP transporter substrate-binding protein [Petroclostridium sp. X23]WHH57835.1 TRAP transporter substrate-binding protein [Petroclostridium sp. X23]
MKRRVFAVLLGMVVMTTLLFTGCGKSAPDSSKNDTNTPAPSSGPAKKAKILTLTFAPASGSAHDKASLEFAKLVEEKTNGAYKVEVYPNSQLAGGNQLTAIEMVQKGAIDFGWLSPLVQTSIVPDLGAMSIPWLWKDVETIDKTLSPGTPAFQKIYDLLYAKDFVVLGFGENGFRQVTNNTKELKSPEDFKGIKFRVIGNKMLLDVFKAFGANPTDINFSEIFTALQQKTIDGQENPVSTIIIPNKFYEVQKYITLWDYSYEPHPFQTNKKLWDSFDDATKKAIQEAAIEACKLQKEYARADYENDLKKLEEADMKVYKPTAEEMKVFKDTAAPVVEKYLPEYDQKLVTLLKDANK